MADPTTCARHAGVETRLRCAVCETAICPRCAVDAPIGMRCPDCARPDRAAGLRRRPDQIGRAVGVAVLGALVGGALIGGVRLLLPIGGLIVAYIVGLQIGQRVRAAASGNTVDVVRGIAIAGAAASGLVAELVIAIGAGVAVGFRIATLLAIGVAVFGAWSALR
jgi:hypothetical protein